MPNVQTNDQHFQCPLLFPSPFSCLWRPNDTLNKHMIGIASIPCLFPQRLSCQMIGIPFHLLLLFCFWRHRDQSAEQTSKPLTSPFLCISFSCFKSQTTCQMNEQIIGIACFPCPHSFSFPQKLACQMIDIPSHLLLLFCFWRQRLKC